MSQSEGQLNEEKEQRMPIWAMPALSWLVAIYFLMGFTVNVGFPPVRSLLIGDEVFVFLWLLYLVSAIF